MSTESGSSGQPCRVVLGSTNDAKVIAVQEAFTLVFGSVTVDAVEVQDTPEQPLTDQATLKGAQHRAQSVRSMRPNADYWVGIEGGIESVADELMVIAWVVILTATGAGRSRSASYQLPKSAAETVSLGRPLGNISANTGPDWRKRGLIASLSEGLITRSSIYVQPVVLALLPFLEPWSNLQGNLGNHHHASHE